jgi:hypothetical protein
VISVPLSSGLLLVVVDDDGEGEEMTNACIVFGSGDDGEVLLVVMANRERL